MCEDEAEDKMRTTAERRRMRRRKTTRPPGSNGRNNQIEDKVEDVERYCGIRAMQGGIRVKQGP